MNLQLISRIRGSYPKLFSGSVAVRYIRSDITGGQLVNGAPTYAGNTYAADVAFFLLQRNLGQDVKTIFFRQGSISRILVVKISYTEGEVKDFFAHQFEVRC